AGFRTNILVCVGSALVMVVSTAFATYPWKPMPGVNINVDPARIAYGVMGGIGFLGAGTIVHYGMTVRGLTTAAGLWCIAAVGLAAGFGLYFIASMATLLVLAVLWVLDYFEDLLPKIHYRNVVIRRTWSPGCIRETVEHLKRANVGVRDINYERRDNDMSHVDITLTVSYIKKKTYLDLERALQEADGGYELIAHRKVET
ncbi:MAG: MgtC/SapB family protein, partial [Tepidisphaeraceae bacterium]